MAAGFLSSSLHLWGLALYLDNSTVFGDYCQYCILISALLV